MELKQVVQWCKRGHVVRVLVVSTQHQACQPCYAQFDRRAFGLTTESFRISALGAICGGNFCRLWQESRVDRNANFAHLPNRPVRERIAWRAFACAGIRGNISRPWRVQGGD
jgi:hypothetical protein